MTAIGIDLGTSNSCIAVWKHDRPEVIQNALGSHTTPSVVAFCNDEKLFGIHANNKLSKYTENVIHGVKYLIGRKYNDKMVQKWSKNCNYDVVFNDLQIKISINGPTETKIFTPEEISGYLLKELKSYAETHLDTKIESAVITVPSYFSDSSRQATIDAGLIAGFKKVDLLNEPTAAALAYGVLQSVTDQNILVFDFGGGTFDVSILKCDQTSLKVLKFDGNLYLGGNDVNKNLYNYILAEMQKEFKKPVNLDKRQAVRLRQECERVKISLSSERDVDINFQEIKGYGDFDLNITRDTFNDINKNIFAKCMKITEKCLQKANLHKADIDVILLVGGSTRIIDVRDRIKEYFGREPKQNINPDEAVAMGAAIMAAKLHDGGFEHINLQQLSAHSLGVEIEGCKFSALIPQYSPIPIEKSDKFYAYEGSDCCTIEIFSGENELTRNNTKLGEFDVKDIPDGREGRMIIVTFKIDSNGVLQVTAVDQNRQSKHLKITLDKRNLTPEQLTTMKKKVGEGN